MEKVLKNILKLQKLINLEPRAKTPSMFYIFERRSLSEAYDYPISDQFHLSGLISSYSPGIGISLDRLRIYFINIVFTLFVFIRF